MVEEKIPFEHKFVTTPLGSQNVFILKQTDENSKGFNYLKTQLISWKHILI